MEENRYGLRNRERNDRAIEEEESDDEGQEPGNEGNDEDEVEEDEEEEERERPQQRQRVGKEKVEDEGNNWEANDGLEEPRELNLNEGDERNQERANRNHAVAADYRGRGGEGLGRGARQGNADASGNQERGIEGLGRGALQGQRNAAAPPAAAPAAAAIVAQMNSMDTPFRPHVANNLRSYESPINDQTKLAAMRSRGNVISLEQLVSSPQGEERDPREYMVCIIHAIVSTGSAQTRGRANGGRYAGVSQQTMSYQRMFRCQCINSVSGRNTFTMFLGEGQGNRMFQASIENRDNGTISKILCICF